MPLIRKDAAGPKPPPPGASGLLSHSVDERWAAARGLSAAADIGVLAGALEGEADARVREAILTSLARIGTPQAAEAVIPLIRSDDASLRTAALDALRAMPVAVAAGVAGLLTDPDPDVRLLACELVRALPGQEPTQLLCGLIDREAEANVAAAAIEVLAEVGGPDALPVLARAAERFADQPFLMFAIRLAAERMGAHGLG